MKYLDLLEICYGVLLLLIEGKGAEKMNPYKLRIAYSGNAVSNGSMKVEDLAPAILGYAELVKRVGTVLGLKDQVEVTISVDSLHKGSIDITLGIALAADLFVKAEQAGLGELLDIVGWCKKGTTVIKNIFELISLIGNGDIKKYQDMGKGGIAITNCNGCTFNVNQNTYNVYVDGKCREEISRVVAPVKKEGIDGFEIRNPNNLQDKTPSIAVNKNSVKCFDAPSKIDSYMITELATEKGKAQIRTVNFGGENWSLSIDDKVYNAFIKDDVFLQKVHDTEISFGNGDVLEIEYHKEIKEYRNGSKKNYIVVTKVLNFEPGIKIKQIPLF